MKKCANCGLVQSGSHSVCIDCGGLLSAKLTARQIADYEVNIKNSIEAIHRKSDSIHVGLFDKIVGIASIVGTATAIVVAIITSRSANEDTAAIYATLFFS